MFYIFCVLKMVILSIVIWILMFMILVILHELWHFTAARKSGVKVLEFWVWIPPKICKLWKDKKGTEYTANIIPLGWFCRLKWEDPSDTADFNAPDSFTSASFWRKIIILLWWVTANFLIAWIVFTVVFSVWTQPISILPENAIKWESTSLLMPTYSYLEEKWFLSGEKINVPLVVDQISAWSLAEELWFQPWDVFDTVAWTPVNARNIWTTLKSQIWQEFEIKYFRDWAEKVIKTTCPETSCVLWIAFSSSGNLQLADIKYPVHKAMLMSLREIRWQWNLTFAALWTLWKSLISFNWSEIKDSLNSLSWPVWVIKVWEKFIENGAWILYLAFAWMISLALAIFNILPIPALDGGRIVWVIIQKVFRIKPEKYFVWEWYVNTVFFVLLMILWLYIILKDLVVFRWISIPFIG